MRPQFRPCGAEQSTTGPKPPATEIIAIDPHTGNREWTYTMTDVTHSGILTTDSIVGREGYFQALDVRNGRLLWNSNLGGQMAAGPIPYEVDGNQYVVIASGHAPFAFAFGD